jgi:MFS transporter, ACDE family, multidrug resistance protein
MASAQETEKEKFPVYKDPNLHVVFGVTLMAVMGTASITPAFPKMVQELGISPGQVGLLVTAFTLPGVFLTPLCGVLADRYGRKRILVPSLILFGLAGSACFLSQDFNLLLGLRLLQGVGAVALTLLSVTIIGDLYSGHDRTAAMGYNSSVLSFGTASYPAIGGALAMLGWYYPFLLPLVAIPIGFLALFSLRNPEPKDEQDLKEHLDSVKDRVGRRQSLGLFAVTLVTFLLLYGPLLTFLPDLIDRSFGATPLVAGIMLSSASIGTAFTAAQMHRVTKHLSERMLIGISFVLYALALCLFVLVPSIWLLLIPTILFGIAQGINLPNVFTLLAGVAPIENRGTFMSVNTTATRLGQTLGPVFMVAATATLSSNGAYFACAALAAAMCVVTFGLIT